MTRTPDSVVKEITKGTWVPVYLLFGDELLARQGVQKIVDALVPTEQQALSVEVLTDGTDAASVPLRLRTVSLLGGLKVVVVHDTKAFVSKQGTGQVFRKSFEAWQDEDAARALRFWMQGVGTAGQDRAFLERAAQGALDEAIWRDVLAIPQESDAENWVQTMAARALAEGAEIPSGMGGTAQIYESILKVGIPSGAVLILTAELVDQRRALFKRINELGVVFDCSVRAGRMGETQMRPELARAKIRELVEGAQKRMDPDAVDWIVERTGFSMRSLASELEKICLFVGTRPRIQVADVVAVLTSARETGLFDLTNALDERDTLRALRAVRGLLVQREAEVAILGLLASEVRQLLMARCAIERHLGGAFDPSLSYPAFQSRVLPRLAEGADDGSAAKLRGMHPFRAFNLLKGASRYPLPELLRALAAIHALDLAGKTTGQLDGVALEGLILGLCGGAPE